MEEITADTRETKTFTEYDAFISYKHGPIDSEAAKVLQQKLEHFRMPFLAKSRFLGRSAGEKPERTIQRVFLDDGELAACAAFSHQIREALEHSRWLIIICSPETKRSPWVNLEIETFLEYHDRDHILALMTSGEPEDIFPEAFIHSGKIADEMLAADARGKTPGEVKRKIGGDALLRLAAPILGMSYDALKQRHRVYSLQRFTAAVLICMAVISGFLMYAFVQNRKLERSNRDLLLRQAKILTGEAEDLLEEGDNQRAVKNLLTALEDADSGTSPLLPEAQYALTKALHLYQPRLNGNYSGDLSKKHMSDRLEACARMSAAGMLVDDLLTDQDGGCILAAGTDRVYVWSTKTDQLLQEISFGERILNWSSDALFEGHRIVLCGGHTAACYDYTSGERIWKTSLINEVDAVSRSRGGSARAALPADIDGGKVRGEPAEAKSAQTDRRTEEEIRKEEAEKEEAGEEEAGKEKAKDQEDILCMFCGHVLSFLDPADGAVLFSQNLGNVLFSEAGKEKTKDPAGTDALPEDFGSPKRAVFTKDGKRLLFTTVEDGKEHLYLFDPEAGQLFRLDAFFEPSSHDYGDFTSFTSEDGNREWILLTSYCTQKEERICVLTAISAGYDTEAGSGRKGKEDGNMAPSLTPRKEWENSYRVQDMYVAEDNSVGFISTEAGSGRILSGLTDSKDRARVIFGCYAHMFLLDPKDGRSLGEDVLTSNLADLRFQNYVRFFTNQGSYYCLKDGKMSRLTRVLPAGCRDIEALETSKAFYCLADSHTIVKYAPAEADDRYVRKEVPEESPLLHPLFQSSDWTVLESYDTIAWISKEDTILGLKKQSLRAEGHLRDIIDEGAEVESGDNFSDPYYLDDIIPLCLEGDELHLLHIARSADTEPDEGDVFYHISQNLADGSCRRKALFRTEDSYSITKNELFHDAQNKLLYILCQYRQTVSVVSCDLQSGRTEQHVLPLTADDRVCYSGISADGKKILLTSEGDLTAWILSLDSWEITGRFGLSEYTRNAVRKICMHPEKQRYSWTGDLLALTDYEEVRVYDSKGRKILSIQCGSPAYSNNDYFPRAMISPDGAYLYCETMGTLTRYSLADGEPVSQTEYPTVDDNGERIIYNSFDDWNCWFDTESPRPVLHILNGKGLLSISCAEDSFGVTAFIKDAAAYNPQMKTVYVQTFDLETMERPFFAYREYTLHEIMEIARERYPGI